MANVTRISTPKNSVIEVLESVLEYAQRGELENIMIVAEHENKEVICGYANADVSTRQYLLSHAQSDITVAVIEANFE